MKRSARIRNSPTERGSALIVVVVLCAVVAISLYAEVPNILFQARRDKERKLIDHANEYKRAVQLYVRRFHRYPPSLDALENTNNIRFLRRRYTDPLTGKGNWRLLHGGPTGLIDSKIAQPNPTGAVANTNSGSDPGDTDEDGGPDLVLLPVPKRLPIIASNLQSGNAPVPSSESDAPLMPAGAAEKLLDNSPQAVDAVPGSDSAAAQQLQMVAIGLGPGIAGVASRASGRSIASIEGQQDYSMWEFPYDPRKDITFAMRGFGAFSGEGINGTGAPGTVSQHPVTPKP